MKALLVLLRAESRNFLAGLRAASGADRWRGLLFLLLLAAFFFAAEFLTFRLFHSFFTVGGVTVELIAIILSLRLLGMIFLVVGALLFFGAMIAAIDAMYFGEDIDFLASRPVARAAVLGKKLAAVHLQSAWVVFLVLTPVMVGYGRAVGGRFAHLPISLFALLLFTVAPVALGAAFVILLMRFLPIDKGREGVLAAGGLLSLGLVYMYRLLSPARLMRRTDEIFSDFTRFVRDFTVPFDETLPSNVMARALVSAVPLHHSEYLPKLAVLAGFALLGVIVYFVIGILFFRTDREISADGSAPGLFEKIIRARPAAEFLSRCAPRGVRFLLYKEIIQNIRDPMQISHILLMFAVVVLHFANLGEMPPFLPPEVLTLIAFLNLALVGFLVAGVAVRFIYPSLSLEGRLLQRLLAAPIAPDRFILVKFLSGWIPLSLSAVFIVAVSNHLIGVDTTLSVLWILAAFAIATAISALAVAIGAVMPALGRKNVFEISSSPGGIIFMLASLLYTGAVLGLLIRPTTAYAFHPGRFPSPLNAFLVAMIFISSAIILFWSRRTATRAFREFEERR